MRCPPTAPEAMCLHPPIYTGFRCRKMLVSLPEACVDSRAAHARARRTYFLGPTVCASSAWVSHLFSTRSLVHHLILITPPCWKSLLEAPLPKHLDSLPPRSVPMQDSLVPRPCPAPSQLLALGHLRHWPCARQAPSSPRYVTLAV